MREPRDDADRRRRTTSRPDDEDRRNKQRVLRRTVLLLGLFGVLVFVPLVLRLFQLQITDGEFYQEKAAQQQTRDLAVSADRGTIYDSEGNVLAVSATVQNLVISPKDIQQNKLDQHIITTGLSQITGVEESVISQRLTRTGSQYEVICRKMEDDLSQRVRSFISENKLGSGVYLEPDSKRYYPYSSLGSHVLGFVGAENKGMYGVELIYNDSLSGASGRVVTAQNGAGGEMLSKYENYIDPQNGLNHHLTLNATIQGFAEKALREGIQKYDVQNGGFCIVMNPKTGGIYAMVSANGYDPNDPSAIADPLVAQRLAEAKEDPEVTDEQYSDMVSKARIEQWRNRCVNDTYEPGSTFKSIVLAAALEEGVVSPMSQFYCSGVAKVAGFDIHCSKRTGHGQQDLGLAVQNSCNPAFMEIGQRLGAKRFYDYMENFGLKATTGIDLNGEGGSVIWSRKFFQSEEGLSSLATASFGQTMKITPIQLVTAASAVVNGGHLITPHVLDYTTDRDGQVVERCAPQEIRQVVSEETSAKVRDILEQVVGASTGTGKNAYQAGYRIGGKTGTSEKTGAGESEDDYIVSFLGIAPANDPEIVVLLAYDTPKPSYHGSSWTAGGTYISGGNMAAPMAGPLMRQILEYLGVEKQYSAAELSGADTAVPQCVGYSVEKAQEILEKRGFTFRLVGEGDKITAQVPANGAVIPGGSQVILYTGDQQPEELVTVPDLTGKSPDAARQALTGVSLFMRGGGSARFFTSSTLASQQSIAPGTQVSPGTVVEVNFVENVNDFAAGSVRR